jgi:hypothetical protein
LTSLRFDGEAQKRAGRARFMAEATKSVLFVDYDSIHRSLATGGDASAERLAPRVAAWVAAIEAGKLFARNSGGARRRRILMRRCYADPSLLGSERSSFLSNGFQVVDCPPAEGRERNAAAIHIVLDAIDALEHPADYEEFILLSAETDLSPVLIRLRAHNRLTAIYANSATSESYKTITDAMVDEQRLVSIVLSDEPATDGEPAAQPAERSEVESLARKISGATNVPLFAPRTFAELFRHLVDEISDNGYHFQTTAENVAARMAAAGRNVTRRQVVFVVKGLALKGHVFSTSDTSERLAEVFREQVVYLAENAGIELDKSQKSVLASWIIGRVAAGSAAGSEEVEIAALAQPGETEIVKPETKSGNGRPARSSRRKTSKSTEPARTETAATPSVARSTPAPEPSKPDTESAGPATPVPTAPARAITVPPKATPTPTRQALGTRPASSLSGPPGTRPAATSPMRTPPVSRPATRLPTSDADKEKVESSILAAIAQAVDVLVEDDGPKSKGAARSGDPRDADPEGREAPPERKAPPPAAEGDAPEGDDIGDEIQRIIASYNRKRDRNG